MRALTAARFGAVPCAGILELVQVFVQFHPFFLSCGLVDGRVDGQWRHFGNQAQGAFCRAVSLPGGLGKPEFGLGGAAFDSIPLQVTETQPVLSLRLSGLGFRINLFALFRGDGEDGGHTSKSGG